MQSQEGKGNRVEINHAPVEKVENTRILVMRQPYPQIEGIAPVRPRHKIKPVLSLETIKHKLMGGDADNQAQTETE